MTKSHIDMTEFYYESEQEYFSERVKLIKSVFGKPSHANTPSPVSCLTFVAFKPHGMFIIKNVKLPVNTSISSLLK